MKLLYVLWTVFSLLASPPPPYEGSTFAEIRERVLRPVPEPLTGYETADEVAIYKAGHLPRFDVSAKTLFEQLHAAARRAIVDPVDWAVRLPKLVHPIGICFTGEWHIDADAPAEYDGAFAPGFRGLFVGRASTANNQPLVGKPRPFGFAGKIFPTMDSTERVKTLNFVTIDNLSGTKVRHYLDTALTNEPDAGFAFTPVTSLTIFAAFNEADSEIFRRPLTSLGEKRAPKWMRIRAAGGQTHVNAMDFRRELDLAHYPKGLTLELHVTDKTKDPRKESAWRRVGEIVLRESAVTYGCDRQLRFKHEQIRK